MPERSAESEIGERKARSEDTSERNFKTGETVIPGVPALHVGDAEPFDEETVAAESPEVDEERATMVSLLSAVRAPVSPSGDPQGGDMGDFGQQLTLPGYAPGSRAARPEPDPLPPPPAQQAQGSQPSSGGTHDPIFAAELEAQLQPLSSTLPYAGRVNQDRASEAAPAVPAGNLPPGYAVGGRYAINHMLGEGGMGKVFHVTHTQLGKSFALKLISLSHSDNPRARDSFFREARLASSLDHPNVVSVVDFGNDPNAGAFMVMEYVQGELLAKRLQSEGRLHIKPALDVLHQTASALHYIHSHGIVHCDIKPENIMLCQTPSVTERRQWTLKLLDFGVARLEQVGAKTQTLEGSPAYIAPERIRGMAPQPSMDIYALGVLAYELFTGKLPFDGGVAEILTAHCHEAPEPPSSRLSQPLDERVDALVMRALAKKPEERHKDAAAFLYELRTLLEMLGFRRRRRGGARARTAQPDDERAATIALAYQLTPAAMATVFTDGKIVVANRAFAKFLTGQTRVDLVGTSLCDSMLATIYPRLSDDLKAAHERGTALRRVLVLTDANENPARLMLWMVPGVSDAGRIHITIHVLD